MKGNKTGWKRITMSVFASCLFFVFLCGCGDARYESSTMVFEKDGHIREYLVEDFPAGQYDVKDWEKTVRSEIDAYNRKGEGDIELGNIELSEDVLNCMVDYDSDDAYYYLNGEPLFYGTVAQAIKAGYSLLTPVYDVNDDSALDRQKLQGMDDMNIIIMDRMIDVKTPGSIRYASDGVKVSGKKHKDAVIGYDGTVYIVFE